MITTSTSKVMSSPLTDSTTKRASLTGVARINLHDRDAQDAIESMLVDGVPFDAVFAGDDESASGVLRALRWAGLRVPDDIAVVGFDDSSLAGHLVPQLTTVDAQVEKAGFTAAQQLVRLIKSGDAEEITLLPTRLVIRRSCGCYYSE